MSKYLALLRGINVGGNNIIKMVDLKTCFETMGFTNVVTYIQSGNVIFTSTQTDLTKLTNTIEQTLSKTFNYKSIVVVITADQLGTAVEKAPKGFGKDPNNYKYDVIFLKPPLTSDEAIKQIVLNEYVDKAFVGEGVLYFTRDSRKLAKSRLSKIITLPIYKSMTIRNWNTTTKLLVLVTA